MSGVLILAEGRGLTVLLTVLNPWRPMNKNRPSLKDDSEALNERLFSKKAFLEGVIS